MGECDFFVSYATPDEGWAEWIAWQLEEHAGMSAFLQAWDFRPGSNFVEKMDEGASRCDRTIAVLSENYLNSRFGRAEWQSAFRNDPNGEKGLLIPVRVGECDVTGLLGQIVYVDLVGLDEDGAHEKLLAGIAFGRAKPADAPPFPGARRAKPSFPGALPALWTLPHRRNPHFTGRQDELAALAAALRGGGPAAVTPLTGLGGVGKTELATEYAYRHAADYDAVLWLRAEDPESLAADYAALAGSLNLPEAAEAEQAHAVAAVRAWLDRHGRWLLVLDNATQPAEVEPFLPRGGTGHTLITSRWQAWGGTATPVAVDVWPRDQSVAFLTRRTGTADEAVAGDLADVLGNLPLALSQAAAYMDATSTDLARYATLYKERGEALRAADPSGTDNTVATTWSLAFDHLTGDGAALLRLCAVLAPDAIPLDVIADGAGHLPPPLDGTAADPLRLDAAVADLRRFSLVDVANGTVSIHRLVQAVTRDRLTADDRTTWVAAALELIGAALHPFPHNAFDADVAAVYTRLLPHAMAAAAATDNAGAAPEILGRLLNHVGIYQWMRAEFAASKAAFERAVAIDEAAFGADHPNVAIRINNLGSVLQDQGDLAGARTAYERALAIDEAAFGADHPKVAIRVNNLGGVLQAEGDLAGARAAFERALAIGETALGPDHPKVAIRVSNLGNVLQAEGDLAGARAAFERALAIDEAAFGPDHPEVATDVNNLGGVLRAEGDLAGARTAYERALAIDEAAFGPNHPNVATLVNNLGEVLHAEGDLAEARAAFERALAIWEKTLGPDHPNTRIARDILRALADGTA